jgi:AraC-like DNA-binding protein
MNDSGIFSRKGYLDEDYHYFHLKDSSGQEHSFHFHEFNKVVLLLSGRVDYIVENTTYPLQPWSVLLVPHHAIHKAVIDVSEPYERIILYLDSDFLDRVLPNAGLMACFEAADRSGQYILLPDARQREELTALLRSFEAAMDDTLRGAEAMRDTLIMQFFILLNRIRPAGEPAAETRSPRMDPKIRDTLAHISENLSGDLSVDTLAARVFLSRYYFMRLFKAQTGDTVHAYIRQKRLLHAARLIREGMPAAQAASACGFHDYSVFNRAFRSSFDIRPADLQKRP